MDRGFNPTLAVSLFESADITTAIINGQQASDASQAKAKTRMGYMGHLTLIAEEVVKFTERHPPELLSEIVLDKVMSQDWINYVEGALAETRERDNAILGGVRPEVSLGHRGLMIGNGLAGLGFSGLGGGSGSSGAAGASSNALAEAGLINGDVEPAEGGDNGVEPFAVGAGTLMSGFGSSSDEEEEGDGDDEDVNSEVSGDFTEVRSTQYAQEAGTADRSVNVIMRSPEPLRGDSPEGPSLDQEPDSPSRPAKLSSLLGEAPSDKYEPPRSMLP